MEEINSDLVSKVREVSIRKVQRLYIKELYHPPDACLTEDTHDADTVVANGAATKQK